MPSALRRQAVEMKGVVDLWLTASPEPDLPDARIRQTGLFRRHNGGTITLARKTVHPPGAGTAPEPKRRERRLRLVGGQLEQPRRVAMRNLGRQIPRKLRDQRAGLGRFRQLAKAERGGHVLMAGADHKTVAEIAE